MVSYYPTKLTVVLVVAIFLILLKIMLAQFVNTKPIFWVIGNIARFVNGVEKLRSYKNERTYKIASEGGV